MQGCGPGGVTFSVSVGCCMALAPASLVSTRLYVFGQLWPYEVVNV